MSADNNEADEETSRCASCGVAENDDIKLKKCTACHLVRYCGVKCQKEHRPKHQKECRKRAAELHDELLFKQPESSHYGDCPICLIPLPLDPEKAGLSPCCSKLVCIGCDYANVKRKIEDGLAHECPLCRQLAPNSQDEANRMMMKRIEANDPDALRQWGNLSDKKGDHKRAFKYWTKAAELGDAVAHYDLSCMYRDGEGVEKDEKKEVYHLGQAAIGGNPDARINLGVIEWNNGQYERAVKHFIIAANLGDVDSMQRVKKLYRAGYVSKEDFASTLRAHHAAVDAMKSPHRELAAADVGYCEFMKKFVNGCDAK